MNRSIVKSSRWLQITGLAVLMMAFSSPNMASAEANTVDNFNAAVEGNLQDELRAVAAEKNLAIEFDDVRVSATAAMMGRYQGDAQAYAEDIISAFESDVSKKSKFLSTRVRPRAGSTLLGTANYTLSVFAGVPAGGACWIKQDFTATVTNYKVTSKTLRGGSYQTGVCVFQWSRNYSYFSGSLNVHSKGTFHAVVKGGPVSFAATFKAIYTVNKSSLKQHVQ